jgi:hypothetical protein
MIFRPALATFLLCLTPALAQTKLQKADVTLAPPKNLKTTLPPGYTIPIVDREKGQYLGQPTTVLLSDQTALLNVDPKGHGRGAIVHMRSYDAGLTWGERLPTPHRTVDAGGKKRSSCSAACIPSAWLSLKTNAQTGGT